MKKIIVILMMIGLLASCKPAERADEAIPETSLQPEQPSEAEAAPLPRATPVETWENIPIMPGAETGDILQEGKQYVFSINTSDAEAAAFYEESLPALGWTYLGLGEGVQGKVLTFQKDETRLVISANRVKPEGYLLVDLSQELLSIED